MSLLRNFHASQKSRERRRRKGQIFLGHRGAPTHSRIERIIIFFLSFSRTLSLDVSSHLSAISKKKDIYSIIHYYLSLALSRLLCLRVVTTYAWNNESERTKYRKQGIRGRDIQKEFDRAYRKKEYFSEI